MDLKALIAKSTAKSAVVTPIDIKPEIGSRPPEKINETVPELDLTVCICGHPHDAHDIDGDDSCNILECECEQFIKGIQPGTSTSVAVEQSKEIKKSFDLKNASIPSKDIKCRCGHHMTSHGWTGPVISGCTECKCNRYVTAAKCPNCEERPCATPDACAQDIAEARAKKSGKPFVIPPGTLSKTGQCAVSQDTTEMVEVVPQPIDTDQETLLSDSTKCRHLCDNVECKKWWTHGDKDKCRYPDLISQGRCLACLNGLTNDDPTKDFADGKFTVAAEVKIRNRERNITCRDMNVEQLTRHIAFLAQEIEKLRIQSLETRKMRAETEEAELENVPEEEREKFIQALRNGNKKTERKPRAKKVKDEESSSPTVRLSAYEKNVQNLMRRTGKTRAEVEAWLND